MGACIASSVSLSLNDTTNTTSAPSPIFCFTAEVDVRLPISIVKCRSLFKSVTTFPSYRAIQDFQTGRSPRLPGAGTPPYTWWNATTTCALRLKSHSPDRAQKFAWVQVRALAMDILDYCEENSVGYGGQALIGTPPLGFEGFAVAVIGVPIRPPLPLISGTDDAFGASETDNAAVDETLWLITS